ncbi:MAG: hypothetical protein DWI24_10740 [Planctomycetota bacterium]|nr:MAG: hypothetical protein DWI24_10740 [Planctomycetota bacterium]
MGFFKKNVFDLAMVVKINTFQGRTIGILHPLFKISFKSFLLKYLAQPFVASARSCWTGSSLINIWIYQAIIFQKTAEPATMPSFAESSQVPHGIIV